MQHSAKTFPNDPQYIVFSLRDKYSLLIITLYKNIPLRSCKRHDRKDADGSSNIQCMLRPQSLLLASLTQWQSFHLKGSALLGPAIFDRSPDGGHNVRKQSLLGRRHRAIRLFLLTIVMLRRSSKTVGLVEHTRTQLSLSRSKCTALAA
eukprot:2550231-Amphidinium_carterae.2